MIISRTVFVWAWFVLLDEQVFIKLLRKLKEWLVWQSKRQWRKAGFSQRFILILMMKYVSLLQTLLLDFFLFNIRALASSAHKVNSWAIQTENSEQFSLNFKNKLKFITVGCSFKHSLYFSPGLWCYISSLKVSTKHSEQIVLYWLTKVNVMLN